MTQERALAVLKTGAHVFLTGEPGSGKTYVVNQYTDYLSAHGVEYAVTASTGIAATHIGGMTIHAWSGIGVRDSLSPYDLDQIATKEKVVKRVNAAKVLIVDEVSMLDGSILDMVDKVCRTIRQSSEPFGGLQVVLVGDFFQLPPVSGRGSQARFAFQSRAWEALSPLTCYLTEQYRQDDETLLSILGAFRRGEVDPLHMEILMACQDTVFPPHIEPTRLYTHNADVDRINEERLSAIKEPSRIFEMESSGYAPLVEGLKRTCLSPEKLELRVGAMVMCTKNNFDAGYANGTLGKVVRFESTTGYPVIETFDKEEITIAPTEWRVEEDGKVRAEIRQLPLRLAWAITVHKSQGMSLDAAEIDLSAAFEYGQGYVALSRVRTLAGLLLRGCNAQALRVHPTVLELDDGLRTASDDVAETFGQLPEDELGGMHERFIKASGGTLTPLTKEVRAKKKKEDKLSTAEKTRLLLLEGKDIGTIAEVRGLKIATVIDHLESLMESGRISAKDCSNLVFGKNDHDMTRELRAAFDAEGTEKLKPIFEYTNGKYDYDTIATARFLFSHGLLK